MVDFRHFDLGRPLAGTPRLPPILAVPTLLGLKRGQIWGFGPSSAQKSILRDSQMQKEVSGLPQIGLDNFLEHFSYTRLVHTGDFWSIWGYFWHNPLSLDVILRKVRGDISRKMPLPPPVSSELSLVICEFAGTNSGSLGATCGGWSIFALLALDCEISAIQVGLQ